MLKTVQDLIDALERYDPKSPIRILDRNLKGVEAVTTMAGRVVLRIANEQDTLRAGENAQEPLGRHTFPENPGD